MLTIAAYALASLMFAFGSFGALWLEQRDRKHTMKQRLEETQAIVKANDNEKIHAVK